MNLDYIFPQFSLDAPKFVYTEEQFINDYAEHKDDVPWYMTTVCCPKDETVRYKLSDYFAHKTTKEEILKKLGRKKHDWLTKIAQFLDVYKYCTERDDEEVAAVPISTTSRFMKTIVGNHTSARLLLEKCQDIELLAKVKHHWFYGHGLACNQASHYILQKEVQDMLTELIEEFGIVHKTVVKHKLATLEEINKVRKIDSKFRDRVKICSSLRIADPFCCKTREEFEELLCTILDDRYPQLVNLKQTADKINQSKFISAHPELQCRAMPSFKWSKGRTCH